MIGNALDYVKGHPQRVHDMFRAWPTVMHAVLNSKMSDPIGRMKSELRIAIAVYSLR